MTFVRLDLRLATEVATWAGSAAETLLFAGPTLHWPFTGEDLLRLAQAEQRHACVLLDADAAVAFGTWRLADDVARIGWVLVNPGRRGEGWGRAMVDFLIGESSAVPGVTRIDLRVFSGNTAAHTLYASLGFLDTGEPRSHLLDGRDWVSTGMELRLP